MSWLVMICLPALQSAYIRRIRFNVNTLFSKNVPLCPYLRKILTDFNFFIATLRENI